MASAHLSEYEREREALIERNRQVISLTLTRVYRCEGHIAHVMTMKTSLYLKHVRRLFPPYMIFIVIYTYCFFF